MRLLKEIPSNLFQLNSNLKITIEEEVFLDFLGILIWFMFKIFVFKIFSKYKMIAIV